MHHQAITRPLTAGALSLAFLASPLLAQEPPPDYLDRLAECRNTPDSAERLACYVREVAAVVVAEEQGDVRIVTREEERQTRRRLFGFTIPKNLFGGEEDQLDLLETSITDVRQSGRRDYLITTEEGSVWRIASPPMRFVPPRVGQKVIFKTASLGSYFIRVNGQIGVKGVRVE